MAFTDLTISYLQSDEGNIHLDHVLNIKLPTFSPSIEKALGRALKSYVTACCDVSRTVTILGYAAAAYLMMAGLSRLIEARNKSLTSSKQ